jgi:hypothetical protein
LTWINDISWSMRKIEARLQDIGFDPVVALRRCAIRRWPVAGPPMPSCDHSSQPEMR